ncbi:hypothetical protein DPMN_092238 [Dreissena polymorpha]|uniref:Uncharacterized protein n=1 Tax=Dreissena polymorpha TaxID=45954 RepID=A0A9D4L1Z6_DREPO|nr:hypothetical protein DPMN_092238 [Dreissena polymorpha]
MYPLISVYRCAVSGSRLYMTNLSHDKLLTQSMDGTVLSSLEDPALRCPSAVHVSESSQLLVCGYTSNNLVQVDGERGVVTLASKEDRLCCPDSVFFSARTGRLIVEHDSDNILVISTT